MNRNLLVAGAVFIIVAVLGFVFNVPAVGWIGLVVGLLVLMASAMRSGTSASGAATTGLGPNGAPIEVIPNEGVVDAVSPPLDAPGPVNPGAPVNAGPPHIAERRNEQFDNNGPVE